jgi:tripartite-type tricarboxylate transporter receptor subunit TctC
MLGPKGLPEEVMARLNTAVVAAVARPEVRKLFSERRIEARSSSPQDMERRIADEIQQWGQVIRKGGITA